MSQRGQKESGRKGIVASYRRGGKKSFEFLTWGGGELLLSASSKVNVWSYILSDNKAGASYDVDSTPSSNGCCTLDGPPLVVLALRGRRAFDSFQFLNLKPRSGPSVPGVSRLCPLFQMSICGLGTARYPTMHFIWASHPNSQKYVLRSTDVQV